MIDEERMQRVEERLRALSEAEMRAVIAAAIVGRDELARELERVGLADEEESPELARWAQPYIMVAVEATRGEREDE